MDHYDDDRYRGEEGEIIFNPEMPDEHEDEEWQAQVEQGSSDDDQRQQSQLVRKRLKKGSSSKRSSDDNQVQQSPKRSELKHADEEWQAQVEQGSSDDDQRQQSQLVRKRLKKGSSRKRSSDDNKVQQSPKRSELKHAGSKKRRPSKSNAEMEEMWKYAAPQDGENDDDQVNESNLPSELKHAGSKKRRPSKSTAERQDDDQQNGYGLPPDLEGVDAAPGRYQPPEEDIGVRVERFIAQLEVAAEEDAELNRQSKPAINKLRLIPTLTQVMSKRPLHGEFLDRGVLSILKNWLEPLPDQSLPNATVRTALLHILAKLPIDTADIERREQLKNSGLGRVIKFLSRSDEETVSNKRLARNLVEKWSRPIFQKPTRLDELEIKYLNSKTVNSKRAEPLVSDVHSSGELESDDFDLDSLQQQYAQERKAREAAGAATKRPEPMAADFVFRPPSKIDADDVRARGKQSKKEMDGSRNRLLQTMKKNQAPKKKKPQGFKHVAT